MQKVERVTKSRRMLIDMPTECSAQSVIDEIEADPNRFFYASSPSEFTLPGVTIERYEPGGQDVTESEDDAAILKYTVVG